VNGSKEKKRKEKNKLYALHQLKDTIRRDKANSSVAVKFAKLHALVESAIVQFNANASSAR